MTPKQEQLLKDHNIEAVCISPFELEEIDPLCHDRNVIGEARGTIAEAFVNQLQVAQSFDFILIRQKDYILSLINKRRLIEARCCLALVSELWTENNYEYKLNELAERIRSS